MLFYAPATLKLALAGLIAFGGMFWAVLRGLWVKLHALREVFTAEPEVGSVAVERKAVQLF